jgi:hypothetical protein
MSMSSLYGAYNSANTDYTNAKVDFWTSVEALNPLNSINEIICFTQHLRPELMVNKGNYSALIDSKICSTSNSSGQNTTNDYVIANVVRESNTSPQIMNLWIPKVNVKARMEVTKEASVANPFGQFNITWKTFGNPELKGEIKTVSVDGGKIGLTLFIDIGGEAKNAVTIVKNPDSSEGIALTQIVAKVEDQSFAKTYALAWSNNLVKAQKHDEEVSSFTSFNDNDDVKTCQDISKPIKSVWSYGVYKNTDGSLLDIQTGFPFEGNKDGKIIYGYLGYWGIWIEGDKEGESLDVITDIKKINYIDDIKTDITISKDDNGKYTAQDTNGKVILFDQPVEFSYTLNGTSYNLKYSGDSLSGFDQDTNGNDTVTLEDGSTLNDGKNDYVVKALQGVNTLASVDNANCNGLTLKDPAEPLPQSISNNAVFNEGNVPNRPDNISFVDGELQN